MASQDMLRKLLDEFVEKEALVSEELKVVTEQIEELEMRLEKCRMRLGTIGSDRSRVMEIKQRYGGGVFYQRAEQPRASAPAAQVSAPVAQPPQPVAPKKVEPTPIPPAPQSRPEPTYSDSVAAAMSPEVSTAKPDVTQRSTISGINNLLGARKADTSQVSFDQQDYQQQLPTPGQPVQQPQPQAALPPVVQPEPQPVPQPQPQPQVQQQPAASNDKVVDIEENQGEDDSDTVKSINDALRSLFR